MSSMVAISKYDNRMFISARGGTRRERGSAIGAARRGVRAELVSITYSETYGFQSATYATYEVQTPRVCASDEVL